MNFEAVDKIVLARLNLDRDRYQIVLVPKERGNK
jgi:hypothetical protein